MSEPTESSESVPLPETVVVLGSGCSAGLGVPTMTNFMDEVFTYLNKSIRSKNGDAKELESAKVLAKIQDFISSVKGSAAYVRTDLLNIEELYGLAEMRESLGVTENNRENGELTAQSAFNRAIYMIAKEAGHEFVDKGQANKFHALAKDIDMIKRESQTEEQSGQNIVSRYTNLVSYLSLASFKDSSGLHPAFIQFNWDLALDRALTVIKEVKNKECILNNLGDHINNVDNDTAMGNAITLISKNMPWLGYSLAASNLENGDKFDFKLSPIVLRPHGAINWVKPTSSYENKRMYEFFEKFEWSEALPLEKRPDGKYTACLHKVILSTQHKHPKPFHKPGTECDSMNI